MRTKDASTREQRSSAHFLRLSVPRTSSLSKGILTMWKSCVRRHPGQPLRSSAPHSGKVSGSYEQLTSP